MSQQPSTEIRMAAEEITAAVLLDPDLIEEVIASIDHKKVPKPYRYILEAVRLIQNKESVNYEKVTQITVWQTLAQMGASKAITKKDLRDLFGSAVSTEGFEDNVTIVGEWLIRSTADEELRSVRDDIWSLTDIERIVADIDSARNKVGDELNRLRPAPTIHDHLHRMNEFIERSIRSNGKITGIPSGYHRLDYLTGGFQSEMIIIAGRPSMGKTAFALNVCMNNAKYYHNKPAIFSYEMQGKDLLLRMACHEAGISIADIKRGKVNDLERERLDDARAMIKHFDMFIDDQPHDVDVLVSKIKSAHRNEDIDFAIIDYLQLIPVPDRLRQRSREREVAEISRLLKMLSQDLDIPIIPVAQLSRETTRRKDTRPRLEDLRESGSLEQDADVVIFVHRPAYYGVKERAGRSMANVAELIVGKQRNGPTGRAELRWVDGNFENAGQTWSDVKGKQA